MKQRKKYCLKYIGLAIIMILVLGTVSPSVAYLSNENFGSIEEEGSNYTLQNFDGESDVWYIDEEVILDGEQFPIDASIQINSTGSLILKGSTLTLLIDGYNPWNITVRDGGELTLIDSTITTRLRENTLRPFLKTNISAYDGSSIQLIENSSFKFPGWVYIENSNLTLRESTFEPLDDVPQFDYTWLNPGTVPAVGISDNNDCPRLIANKGSHVLIEDSEIISNYKNEHLNTMEWDADDLLGDYTESDEIPIFYDDVSEDLGYISGTNDENASEWSIIDDAWDWGDGSFNKTTEGSLMSWLISPSIEISDDMYQAELTFEHWRDFNDSELNDAGNLKISTDGVDGPWEIIYPEGDYDGTVEDNTNLLFDEYAWGGTQGWESVTFDLTDYIGETIHLNWTAATNVSESGSGGGWRLDQITVTGWSLLDQVIIGPGEHVQVDAWNLLNPQFPTPGGDVRYPYMNPFNKISALFIGVEFEAEEDAQGTVYYSTPDGIKEAFHIPNDNDANIFEPGLDKIGYHGNRFTKDLTVWINNTADEDIVIEDIKLYSAFDNDMQLWDSTMTVINSVIDIDFNPSDVDPRDSTQQTDKTNWMANADQNHRVIRLLGGSNLKTYGLVPTDTEPTPEGDPIVVTDEASNVNIYRWIDLTAKDNSDNLLSGAEISFNLMRGRYNDPEYNPEALDYMERKFDVHYNTTSGKYITNERGQTFMFLLSDNITHPQNWPNSKYLGHYTLQGLFEDEERGVEQNETFKDITQTSFPNMHDNVKEIDLIFDMDIPSPDLHTSDADIFTLVNGEPTSFVAQETNVTIELTVHNLGDYYASNVTIEFYSQDEAGVFRSISQEEISYIGENESATATTLWVPNEIGDHTIIAAVDPYDEIQTWDDDKHLAETDITVGWKPLLRALDLTILPDNRIEYNTPINISAGIDNIGGIDVENVNVSFYYDHIDEEHRIGTEYIDVAGNGTEYVTTTPLDWEYPDVGEYDIIVVVDPNHEIDVEDRFDNELSRTLSILSESDLQITDFQLSHEEIYEDEELTIDVTIENMGGWTSEATHITFYVDDDEIRQVDIPPLNGGDTLTISEVWSAEMELETSQERIISVELDDIELNLPVTVTRPAHLSIEYIQFPPELTQIYEEISIDTGIYNAGGETVEVHIYFYEDTSLIGHETTMIGGLTSTEISTDWEPGTWGNTEITVEVYVDEELHDLERVIKPIFSEGYQDDMIVNDNNTPVTLRGYSSNGFIVVEEGGELTIGGEQDRRILEMIQDHDNEFSVIVRDQGRLIIDNLMVYSDNQYSILVEDDAHLEIMDSIIYGEVTIQASGDSILNIYDSSIRGAMDITSAEFNVYESEFTSTDIMVNPLSMEGINSTFQGHLNDFYHTHAELIAVESPSIDVFGQARVNVSLWMTIRTESYGGVLLTGTHVRINSIDTEYQVEGTTQDGVVNLPALTNILTPQRRRYVGNYEIYAEYSERETEESYTDQIRLPSYPPEEYVIDITITFEDLLIPDLAVTDDDLTIDPIDVQLGDLVRIHADVSNLGMADAFQVSVGFYLEVGPDEYELIDTDTLTRVDSGATERATGVWDAADMIDQDLSEESRRIRVYIYPEMDPLSDPKLENNEAFTQITVRSPPRPEFDLMEIIMLVDGRPIENNTVLERDDIEISVHIVNHGGTLYSNASIEFSYDDVLIGQNITDMPVGQVLNVTESWTADVTGEVTIDVVLNTTTEIQSISRTITVEEMDLRFVGVSVPLEDKDMGEIVTVLGDVVRDIDGKPLRDITVNAYLIDEDGNVEAEAQGVTGEGGSFYIDLVTPEKGGTFWVLLQPEGYEVEYTSDSFQVIDPAAGIPLWMVALIIIVVVAASLVGMILYLKFKGEGEWVECGECGSTIPAESTSCPKCGTDFEMDTVKCSECGEWIPGESSECPHCGVEFITTGKEVEDYSESMKKQYEKYINKNKRLAKEDLGDDFTEEEFMDWWMEQPSYLTFDDWLEQEEARRRKGGIECPQCGSLNSVDDALCQKCGSSIVQFAPVSSTEEKDEDDEALLLDLEDIEKIGEEETEEEKPPQKKVVKKVEKPQDEPEEEEEKPPQKKVVKKVKKQPKRVSKRVKKKVVKKPDDE